MTSRPIPVIELAGYLAGSPAAADEAARALRHALENVGFFFIRGHGVDWRLVDAAYAQTRRFFALPQQRKEALAVRQGKRGYIALGGSTSYSSQVDESKIRKPNLVESLYLDYEESGRNQWPEDLDGFRDGVMAYFAAIDSLAHRLLPLYARALELPEHHFEEFFGDPTIGLRISHYPVVPGASDDEWGISAHTDRSFMTLLPTNDVSGLWIRPEKMQWMEAPKLPEAFLINAGDVLRRWTNDRFLSTPHRVARPKQDRYAIPYFFSPGEDTVLQALPGCASHANPDRYQPITCGEFDRQFLKANYGSTALLS